MNKPLYFAFVCITMLGVACAKPAGKAQSDFPAACGGYTDYRALSDEDVTLFTDVYDAEPTLTPYAVATQVVAGTNFRFLCRDAALQEYVVTIFVPLPCYADTQQPRVTGVQFPLPTSLVGTWTVCRFDEIVLTEDSAEYPSIMFMEDGHISATAGCNGMGSEYVYQNGLLTITDGMCQTMMWCENEQIMRNERLLAETLVGTIEVSSPAQGSLILKGKHSLMIVKRIE